MGSFWLEEAGLLDGNPPILYSGSLTAPQLARILKDGAQLVVTDTNRVYASGWSPTSPARTRSPKSPALPGTRLP